MILTSPNHYTGRGQNLSVLTDLAWNEKRPSLLSFHISWDIIPCGPHLSLIKYFLSRNPDQDHTLHRGQMRDILKTLIGLMDKRKDLEQKSNDWDRARRRKAIDWGHPRKLWGRLCKSKKKKKKKKKEKKMKWKENALSILRRAKGGHNKCQKSTPKKKIKFHVFWCV